MPFAHQPRLEMDVIIVVEVGIAPLGILVVGQTVLDDENHSLRLQHIAILEVAQTAYFIAYPIPLSATVEELLLTNSAKRSHDSLNSSSVIN